MKFLTKTEELIYISKVLHSCKTSEHIECVTKMMSNYKSAHSLNEGVEWNQLTN